MMMVKFGSPSMFITAINVMKVLSNLLKLNIRGHVLETYLSCSHIIIVALFAYSSANNMYNRTNLSCLKIQ